MQVYYRWQWCVGVDDVAVVGVEVIIAEKVLSITKTSTISYPIVREDKATQRSQEREEGIIALQQQCCHNVFSCCFTRIIHLRFIRMKLFQAQTRYYVWIWICYNISSFIRLKYDIICSVLSSQQLSYLMSVFQR